MSKIGLFYASSTGNTEDTAQLIQEKLKPLEIDLHNIDSATDNAMENYTKIIIGASTWGEGDLQDDWEEYFPNLDNIDFSNKTVALFGLGDQDEYGEYFLNAMGTIYQKVVEKGAKVVGSWPIEDYDFEASTAVVDGEFVGLALDEDNEFDLTQDRVSQWTEQIKPYFQGAA